MKSNKFNRKMIGLICCIIIVACNNESGTGKRVNNVSIEVLGKNCGDSNLCVQATFQLNKFYKKEKALLDRMDKELIACFSYQYNGIQVMPLAAERVETGHLDKIVYMIYFSGVKGKTAGQKLMYKDIFFDLKEQDFHID